MFSTYVSFTESVGEKAQRGKALKEYELYMV
jgi:hypothetical protein